MIAPTCQQLFDDELESVLRVADDSWRHGSRVTQVFHRKEDNTFWMAKYRLSADGEANELREGLATITQVEPFAETVTNYRPFTGNEANA